MGSSRARKGAASNGAPTAEQQADGLAAGQEQAEREAAAMAPAADAPPTELELAKAELAKAELALAALTARLAKEEKKPTGKDKWPVTLATRKVWWLSTGLREAATELADKLSADLRAGVQAMVTRDDAPVTVPGVAPARTIQEPITDMVDAEGNPVSPGALEALGLQSYRTVTIEGSNDYGEAVRMITQLMRNRSPLH